MNKETNQVMILCLKCGCYYYYDVEYDSDIKEAYNKAVYLTPQDMNKKCPECGNQEIAEQYHHSADYFNCGTGSGGLRPPRYNSGPGSFFEPIKI